MARRPPKKDEAIIAINPETKRVGCVLLQAAMGGNSFFVERHFETEYWTTSPSGLKLFRLGKDEVDRLKELADKEGA